MRPNLRRVALVLCVVLGGVALATVVLKDQIAQVLFSDEFDDY